MRSLWKLSRQRFDLLLDDDDRLGDGDGSSDVVNLRKNEVADIRRQGGLVESYLPYFPSVAVTSH